jgi:hypothetical protein
MTTTVPFGRSAGHTLLFARRLIGAAMPNTNAFAGECPAGKAAVNLATALERDASIRWIIAAGWLGTYGVLERKSYCRPAQAAYAAYQG